MKRASPSFFFLASTLACALLTSADARAAGVDPAEATPVQREQAQQRFLRGRDLFAKRDFANALTEFLGSHDIVASPNARLFVARCERELGKIVAAYAELGRVIVEAHEFEHEDPRYAKTADSANAEREELAPQLAFVSVNVLNATAETKLTIAGDDIARAGWSEPVPVSPGTTEIVVETPGHAPARATVMLSAAERKPITLDALAGDSPGQTVIAKTDAPAPRDEADHGGGTRAMAYVAGGIGVAGFVAFAIEGSAANSTYSDLESQCHGACDASKTSEISRGKTQQTIANVGLAVGIAGLGAGVTLFVMSLSRSRDTATGPNDTTHDKASAKTANDASAALTVGPSWIGMRGAF